MKQSSPAEDELRRRAQAEVDRQRLSLLEAHTGLGPRMLRRYLAGGNLPATVGGNGETLN